MNISVIIPVYNFESYLESTLKSLLDQTYKDFEVILVNDGSVDRSPDICDEYAAKYNCIKVIHKPNGGVSSARNVGIENAQGEWIFFLDGDDLLTKDAFETLIKTANETNCDIIEGNYIRVLNSKTIYTPLLDQDNYIEDSIECIQNTLMYQRILIIPRLFKREIIGNFRFDNKIKIGEDILFTIQILLNSCVKIAHTHQIIYHYIQRLGSATHNHETMVYYDVLSEAMEKLLGIDSPYGGYFQIFKSINLYFKAVKSNSSLSKEDYKCIKGHFYLFFREKRLSLKFRLLFCSYCVSRHLGNLLLKARMLLFPVY